jgi:hypothetical protein
MRNRWSLLALLLGLGVGLGAVLNGTAGADETSDRVARLVKELGSSKFTVRDRAKRQLEAIGRPALDALRQAARSSDLETSRRAGELVKHMEEKMALESLLAPKKVHLKLKDTPVLDAVDQLARQSGYTIQIQGDRAALASRKVTLDTGATTFWQAFDQLCQKAGLVENTNPYNPYVGRPVPIQPLPVQPPIRIQPAPAPAPLPVLPPGGLKPLPPVRLPPVQIQPAPGQPPMLLPALPPAAAPPAPPAPPVRNPQQGAVQVRIEAKPQVIQLAVPAQAQAGGAAQAAPAQAAPPLKVAPPVQIQIQVQGGQVQVVPGPQVVPLPAPANPPVQIRPGVIVRPTPVQPYPQGQFNLIAGKPQDVPTCYSGAVRVRALSGQSAVPGVPAPPRQKGETLLTLEVAAEPRLQNFQLMDSVQIEKAIDDQGQTLSVPMGGADPFAAPGIAPGGLRSTAVYRYNPYMNNARLTHVRLKLGEKQAKTLKELKGHISAQMLAAPQALITVEDVLKASGKKFKGVGGSGALEMLSTEKQADGSYKVQFRLEQPQNWIQAPFQGPVAPALGNPAGGAVQIGNGRRVIRPYINTHGLPTLVDAKGRALQLTQIPTRLYRGGFGVMTMEVTMVFRAHDGQGEPAQLVLHGQRNISVQVPFTLRDVPLP